MTMQSESAYIPTDFGPWEVETSPVGVHVAPVQAEGFIEIHNWELYAGRRGSYFFRSLGIVGRRRVYPKTKKQLAKAIADCQRFCDRENAKDAAGKALLS